MWGAYFCMGAYKHDVEIKMGAYIHGVYFVWVLIIPILQVRHFQKVASKKYKVLTQKDLTPENNSPENTNAIFTVLTQK